MNSREHRMSSSLAKYILEKRGLHRDAKLKNSRALQIIDEELQTHGNIYTLGQCHGLQSSEVRQRFADLPPLNAGTVASAIALSISQER